MNRRRAADGYAMLTALLVMVLAATFVLVVVGAVHSVQIVERSDAAGWRADAVMERGLAATTDALRWRPGAMGGTAEGVDRAGPGSWKSAWVPAPPVAGGGWPRLRVSISAVHAGARRQGELTMELRAEPWAVGVTCSGDAEIIGRLTVSGSGVYVGGCLRGRDQLVFTQGTGPVTPAGDPADGVRGDVFSAAAVHSGAGIFAGGAEIHESPEGGGIYALDTDPHSGDAVPEVWLAPPPAEFLVAATAAAASPGQALSGTRLDLRELNVAPGDDAAVHGTCIIAPPMDELTIEGSAPSEAGRLLLVVRGDAVLGEPGQIVTLSGGLVVSGHLSIRGEVTLAGSLHAGSLTIDGQATIDVPPGWRQLPLAGSTMPVVVESGR